jgi:hypothetical protein
MPILEAYGKEDSEIPVTGAPGSGIFANPADSRGKHDNERRRQVRARV